MALPDAPQAVLPELAETDRPRPRRRHRCTPARWRTCTDELTARRSEAHFGHDPEADARHLSKGKLLARQRIEKLLDQGTFTELGTFAEHRATGFGMEDSHPEGDGVITGWGEIDGRKVFVFAHDARVRGGALGATFAAKIHQLLDFADSVGAPVIGLNDGGGARIQEGIDALAGFGKLFARNVRAVGRGAADQCGPRPLRRRRRLLAGAHRLHLHGRGMANMFITGPDVVHAVTGEQIDAGGARRCVHARHADRCGDASWPRTRRPASRAYATCSPSCRPTTPSRHPVRGRRTTRTGAAMNCCVWCRSTTGRRTTSGRSSVMIVDDGDYLEVQESWAPNIVCALARLDGHTVGVVGNQPAALAGALDIDASEKAARFVRTCDAFNIPLVTLVDVPGFLPGTDQEHDGDHPARRQTAVRVLRGDGAAGPGDPAQGVRRRVHRHGLQVHRFRPVVRLAVATRSP